MNHHVGCAGQPAQHPLLEGIWEFLRGAALKPGFLRGSVLSGGPLVVSVRPGGCRWPAALSQAVLLQIVKASRGSCVPLTW